MPVKSTIFNENIVFSISALLLKNQEYERQIQNLIGAVRPDSLDYERYFVDIQFGDRVIETSVAPPDVTLISLNNVRDLAHRIRENNVMIKALVKSQPPYEMGDADLAAIIEWLEVAPE